MSERFDPTRYIETSVIRKFRITAADLLAQTKALEG